jgi:hypothetical protein
MEHLLELQLYNLFQGGKIITWDDLLKTMSGTYGRNRDEVYDGMNQLIDSGKIVLPSVDTYCLPDTLAKIQKKEQENQAWEKAFPDGKTMIRADFDKMNPEEKMEFCNIGGRIS